MTSNITGSNTTRSVVRENIGLEVRISFLSGQKSRILLATCFTAVHHGDLRILAAILERPIGIDRIILHRVVARQFSGKVTEVHGIISMGYRTVERKLVLGIKSPGLPFKG
jgi:hypothetical protein